MARDTKEMLRDAIAPGNESVARFDDLVWNSAPEPEVEQVVDHRPSWLRRILPVQFAEKRPLEGMEMARIELTAFH